jgi:hypothetical protein
MTTSEATPVPLLRGVAWLPAEGTVRDQVPRPMVPIEGRATMPSHSNKQIQQHVEDSSVLLAKMQTLTSELENALVSNFEKTMGVPLPTIVDAVVRQTDITMVYSTDPSVDEYINGARKLLGASLQGETIETTNRILDVVDVIVRRIIGTGHIRAGIHSTAAHTGRYITAVFSAIEEASAKDWLTKADFFVAYYAFVIFRPTPQEKVMLAMRPKLGTVMAEFGSPREVDVREIASRNYTHTPLWKMQEIR